MELDEPLLRALADASPDGVVIADGEGRIRYANAAVARLLGHPQARLQSGDLGLLRASWKQADAAGTAVVEYERADGTRFVASTVVATLRGADGRVLGRAATIRPRGADALGEPDFVTAAEMEARRRDNLLSALQQADYRITGPGGAAALLGLPPSTLRSQMRALGIARTRPSS